MVRQRMVRAMPKQKANRSNHMPPLWPDQDAYDRLYDEIDPFGNYAERIGPNLVRRIPPGLSARAVCQRLPSAMNFEYAGYLTETQIVYWKGGSHSARSLTAKACTFHSHPTRLGPGEPDLPSAADIRFFLIGRHRRTITVGRFKIWVWDKTPKTLVAARRLFDWESKNLLKTCHRLQAKGKSHWEERLVREGLRQVGVSQPNKSKLWDRIWMNEVQTRLGFKVTMFERDGA